VCNDRCNRSQVIEKGPDLDYIQKIEKTINEYILFVHQNRDPLARARLSDEATAKLRGAIEQLNETKRKAIAEAVQWPGASLSSVAKEMNLSKSAIAKLAPPSLKEVIGRDLRERLAGGFNPPPTRK
jgi:hypothetical protein